MPSELHQWPVEKVVSSAKSHGQRIIVASRGCWRKYLQPSTGADPVACARIASYDARSVSSTASGVVLWVPWKSLRPGHEQVVARGQCPRPGPLRRPVVLWSASSPASPAATSSPITGRAPPGHVRYAKGARTPVPRRRHGPVAARRRPPGPPSVAGTVDPASCGANASETVSTSPRRIRACAMCGRPTGAAGRVVEDLGPGDIVPRRPASAPRSVAPAPDRLSRTRAQLGGTVRGSAGSNRYASRCRPMPGSPPCQRQNSSMPRNQGTPGGTAAAASAQPAGVVVGDRDHGEPPAATADDQFAPGVRCRRWRWSARAGRCASRHSAGAPVGLTRRRRRSFSPLPSRASTACGSYISSTTRR